MFCRELAAQVRGEQSAFEAKGYRVVFIGNGKPFMAKAFAEDYQVSAPLYTDPTLVSYKIAGFKRGMGGAGGMWKSVKHAGRALKGGHMQGLVQGDATQQGGLLAIDRDGSVLYAHVSDEAGDHPVLQEVLATLPKR